MTRSKAEIQAIIRSLDYDFDQFELHDFIGHIERLRGRKILVYGMDFQSDLFGLWIPGQAEDFVFYNENLYSVHQIHSILHELAHMVLGHANHRVDTIITPEILKQFEGIPGDKPPTHGLGRLRKALTLEERDAQEEEAEMFVFAIQGYLMAARRIDELYKGHSSIEFFRPIADGMAFDER